MGASSTVWRVLPQRLERRAQFGREQLRVLPHREVAAPVGLVEVDQVAEGAPGPASGARKTSSGNTVMATGTAISSVFCAAG